MFLKMSSSENTRSATTLQLAGLNCILLLLPKVISACFKWSATVALLKMDLLQLMQVHLIFNRILLASSSESILVLGLLCSWTNFPLSKSKATFFEGESRGPIRFVTPPVGTPRWSSSTSSTFNSHLWCFSGSKFDKCAIFSRALPLLKTPCPSNRLGFVFSLVGRRWLATSDFSTLPTAALLRSPLDLAVILFEGRFSGRFPFQTGRLLHFSTSCSSHFSSALKSGWPYSRSRWETVYSSNWPNRYNPETSVPKRNSLWLELKRSPGKLRLSI